jgi:hypothetical protein
MPVAEVSIDDFLLSLEESFACADTLAGFREVLPDPLSLGNVHVPPSMVGTENTVLEFRLEVDGVEGAVAGNSWPPVGIGMRKVLVRVRERGRRRSAR